MTRSLKTVVVGTLPLIKNWRGRVMPLTRHDNGTNGNLPATRGDRHLTGFDEAVRSLRNSILLTDFDRRLRSVLMTSASPSEGKTTVAAHLAVVHAGSISAPS